MGHDDNSTENVNMPVCASMNAYLLPSRLSDGENGAWNMTVPSEHLLNMINKCNQLIYDAEKTLS